MEREAKITVQGLQYQSKEQVENITSEYSGKYTDKGNMQYLTYKEHYEGVDEETRVMLKVGINEVDVVKRGALSSVMRFKKGEKMLCDYQTPYGMMKLGLNTQNLTICRSEDRLTIDIYYILDMDDQYLSDNKLKINAYLN